MDRFVLIDDPLLQILFECRKHGGIVHINRAVRKLEHPCYPFGDLGRGDFHMLFAMQHKVCPHLIDDVHCLVGEEPVVDVLNTQINCCV